MSTGILRIQTFTARQAGALPGVAVTVTGDGFTQSFVTDQEGNAPDFLLPAPDVSLSFDQGNTTRQPYALVDITARLEGWQTLVLRGVQIFDGQVTLAPLEFAPSAAPGTFSPQERESIDRVEVEIPPHPLFAGSGSSGWAPVVENDDWVLNRVIIPKNITVHLGKPSANVSNVTVPFVDYISNVASGEIYPTWAGHTKPTF